ncbi:Conserved_hypothetical protein [Hexamita inflata]|uniref:Uncharacterized protein n=1 Tax=Hexamita inflata TaxID=28002 RepID=A0AA86UAQ7_9EUKA|nr:Conserved hypothetical protein [Hexamita inflata]CAI9950275.1 Conserved hypothetical protein [Hexamita inflata]
MQIQTCTRQLAAQLQDLKVLRENVARGEIPEFQFYGFLQAFNLMPQCKDQAKIKSYIGPFLQQIQQYDSYEMIRAASPSKKDVKAKQPVQTEQFSFSKFVQCEQNLMNDAQKTDQFVTVRHVLMLQLLINCCRNNCDNYQAIFELCQRALFAVQFQQSQSSLHLLQIEARIEFISFVCKNFNKVNSMFEYQINEELKTIFNTDYVQNKFLDANKEQLKPIIGYISLNLEYLNSQITELKQAEITVSITALQTAKNPDTNETFLKFFKYYSDQKQIKSMLFNMLIIIATNLDQVTNGLPMLQLQFPAQFKNLYNISFLLLNQIINDSVYDNMIFDAFLQIIVNGPNGYQFVDEFSQIYLKQKQLPMNSDSILQNYEAKKRSNCLKLIDMLKVHLLILKMTSRVQMNLVLDEKISFEKAEQYFEQIALLPQKYLTYQVDKQFLDIYFSMKLQLPEGNYVPVATEIINNVNATIQLYNKNKVLLGGADIFAIDKPGKLLNFSSSISLIFRPIIQLLLQQPNNKEGKKDPKQTTQITEKSNFILEQLALDVNPQLSLLYQIIAPLDQQQQLLFKLTTSQYFVQYALTKQEPKVSQILCNIVEDISKSVFKQENTVNIKNKTAEVLEPKQFGFYVYNQLVSVLWESVQRQKFPQNTTQILKQISDILQTNIALQNCEQLDVKLTQFLIQCSKFSITPTGEQELNNILQMAIDILPLLQKEKQIQEIIQIVTLLIQNNTSIDVCNQLFYFYETLKQQNTVIQPVNDNQETKSLKMTILEKTIQKSGLIGDQLTQRLQQTAVQKTQLPIQTSGLEQKLFRITVKLQTQHAHYEAALQMLKGGNSDVDLLKLGVFCALQFKDYPKLRQIILNAALSNSENERFYKYLLNMFSSETLDIVQITPILKDAFDIYRERLRLNADLDNQTFKQLEFLCAKITNTNVIETMNKILDVPSLQFEILESAININDEIIKKIINSLPKENLLQTFDKLKRSFLPQQNLKREDIQLNQIEIKKCKIFQKLMNTYGLQQFVLDFYSHIVLALTSRKIDFELFTTFTQVSVNLALQLKNADKEYIYILSLVDKITQFNLQYTQFYNYLKQNSVDISNKMYYLLNSLIKSGVYLLILGHYQLCDAIMHSNIIEIELTFQNLYSQQYYNQVKQQELKINQMQQYIKQVYQPYKVICGLYEYLVNKNLTATYNHCSFIYAFCNTKATKFIINNLLGLELECIVEDFDIFFIELNSKLLISIQQVEQIDYLLSNVSNKFKQEYSFVKSAIKLFSQQDKQKINLEYYNLDSQEIHAGTNIIYQTQFSREILNVWLQQMVNNNTISDFQLYQTFIAGQDTVQINSDSLVLFNEAIKVLLSSQNNDGISLIIHCLLLSPNWTSQFVFQQTSLPRIPSILYMLQGRKLYMARLLVEYLIEQNFGSQKQLAITNALITQQLIYFVRKFPEQFNDTCFTTLIEQPKLVARWLTEATGAAKKIQLIDLVNKPSVTGLNVIELARKCVQLLQECGAVKIQSQETPNEIAELSSLCSGTHDDGLAGVIYTALIGQINDELLQTVSSLTTMQSRKVSRGVSRAAKDAKATPDVEVELGPTVTQLCRALTAQISDFAFQRELVDTALEQPEFVIFDAFCKNIVKLMLKYFDQPSVLSLAVIQIFFQARIAHTRSFDDTEALILLLYQKVLQHYEMNLLSVQISNRPLIYEQFKTDPLQKDPPTNKISLKFSNKTVQEAINQKLGPVFSALGPKLGCIQQAINGQMSNAVVDPKKDKKDKPVAASNNVQIYSLAVFDEFSIEVSSGEGQLVGKRVDFTLENQNQLNQTHQMLEFHSRIQKIVEWGGNDVYNTQKIDELKAQLPTLNIKFDKPALVITGQLAQQGLQQVITQPFKQLIMRYNQQQELTDLNAVIDPLNDLAFAELNLKNYELQQKITTLKGMFQVMPLKTAEEISNTLLQTNSCLFTLFQPSDYLVSEYLKRGQFKSKVLLLEYCELGFSYLRSQRNNFNQLQRMVADTNALYLLCIYSGVGKIIKSSLNFDQFAQFTDKLCEESQKYQKAEAEAKKKGDTKKPDLESLVSTQKKEEFVSLK